MGIAYITSLQHSIWCKSIIKPNEHTLVKCQFNNEKNKWLPLSVDTSQMIPTDITEIEKYMNILEKNNDD